MSDERKKILEMLATGKITTEEAEKLLNAVESKIDDTLKGDVLSKTNIPRYLFVKVDSTNGDKVNIRVPLKIIRAGIKLKSLIPQEAQEKIDEKLGEKGVNFKLEDISDENIHEFMEALTEFEVNVEDRKGENVRIYCGDA
jgi:2,3-bisphosphoglycerate-independent phosphoglycerate mutase